MLIKHALARAEDNAPTVELVVPGQHVKTAGILPAVSARLEALRPDSDHTYALGTAMSDSWYFGANSNADWYGYNPHLRMNGLTWDPDKTQEHGDYTGWRTDPIVQQRLAKQWPYGYPTFYGANVFAHHKNHNPALGFGDVVFVYWNEPMKRVELLMRINNRVAAEKGHSAFLERVHAGKRVDLSMGCFAAGAYVTLFDGTRKLIETIEVGDRVLTHTGRVGRVTEVHRRRYEGGLLEVRPANEDPFIATAEHPFFAAYGAKDRHRVWKQERPDFGWVYARDLPGAVLSRPKLQHRRVKQVSPALARLLGYYLAEGHPVQGKHGKYAGIELSVGKKDAVVREIAGLCAELGVTYTKRDVPHTDKAATLGVYKRKIADLCVKYCGKFSKQKKLHPDVFHWGREQQLQFLGAYINGDGFSANGGVGISTGSVDLVHQVRELLFGLGIPASYQRLVHKAGSGFSAVDTTEWTLHVGRQWVPALAPYCAKAKATPVRKPINHYKEYDDLWAVPIRAYTRGSGSLDVYNFEVEGDNSYIVNGIAAHNCKIPWDACEICCDWGTVRHEMSKYNPKVHAHPGIPVLDAHRKKKIRGIAETRVEYCEHMKNQKNAVLPDGRKVFVYNDFCRFFDISMVWIGADRTAKIMVHVGPKLQHSLRQAKTAMMEKEIPGGVAEVLHDADTAPEMQSLQHLGADPKRILASMAMLGIIPTPQEFMGLVLPGMPGGEQINRMCRTKGVIFDTSAPGADYSHSFSMQDVDAGLVDALRPWMAERSSFEPHLSTRLKDPQRKKLASVALTPLRSPVLDDVAAKYAGFRIGLLEKAMGIAEHLPSMTEGGRAGPEFAGLLLGIGTVVHWVASHLQDKKARGEQLNPLESMIAKNPGFSSLASIGVALKAAIEVDKAGGIAKALGKVVSGLRSVA